MAKADLEVPFAGIHGRIGHDSEIYYTQRYGKTVVSNYPKHRNPKTISDHQKALNTNFQTAVKRAAAELADSVRRAYWQNLFDHQPAPPKYKVIRNFIIAQLTKTPE